MTKTFDTTFWMRSHGSAPKGRGSWAFCPADKAGQNDSNDHTVFSPSMTFTEARKWAAKNPAFADVQCVSVMP